DHTTDHAWCKKDTSLTVASTFPTSLPDVANPVAVAEPRVPQFFLAHALQLTSAHIVFLVNQAKLRPGGPAREFKGRPLDGGEVTCLMGKNDGPHHPDQKAPRGGPGVNDTSRRNPPSPSAPRLP